MSLECEYSQNNNINVNFEQIVNITVMKNEIKKVIKFWIRALGIYRWKNLLMYLIKLGGIHKLRWQEEIGRYTKNVDNL